MTVEKSRGAGYVQKEENRPSRGLLITQEERRKRLHTESTTKRTDPVSSQEDVTGRGKTAFFGERDHPLQDQ